jgi:hypothetical protein
VALLSQQLRRFLDDQAWLENRRIMQVLHEIEAHALAVREAMPQGVFMEIDDAAPSIELPMERPLFTPPLKPRIAEQIIVDGDGNVAADALFDQVVLDKERLAAHVRQALQVREQITLTELLDEHPLEQGLAELVAYLSLAGDDSKALFDETHCDTVQWCDAQGVSRSASLPRVIFNR